MSEELKGFWKDDRWDIRKCPHPSAMEIAKRKAVRIRWVNFQDIENIWLKIELKYFFFYHIKMKYGVHKLYGLEKVQLLVEC